MRSINASLSGVDDDEHFRRKVSGFAVENNARNLDLIQQLGVLHAEKMQAGEAVLAVDDQESGLRILQIAHRFEAAYRTEFQDLFGKQQNAAGDGGLGLGGLV